MSGGMFMSLTKDGVRTRTDTAKTQQCLDNSCSRLDPVKNRNLKI